MGDPEVLPARPHILDLVDIRVKKANGSGHLLEYVRQILGAHMVKFWVVHVEVVLPGHPHQVGVFFKDVVVALLQKLCQRPPIFPPLVDVVLQGHA